MAHGKAQDDSRERQWRRWLREWQASGRSVRDFCWRRRLRESSFYAWRRELRRRDAETAVFVPVRVVPDDAEPKSTLEVVLATGRRVRVAPGFDAGMLRQVLAILEESRSC